MRIGSGCSGSGGEWASSSGGSAANVTIANPEECGARAGVVPGTTQGVGIRMLRLGPGRGAPAGVGRADPPGSTCRADRQKPCRAIPASACEPPLAESPVCGVPQRGPGRRSSRTTGVTSSPCGKPWPSATWRAWTRCGDPAGTAAGGAWRELLAPFRGLDHPLQRPGAYLADYNLRTCRWPRSSATSDPPRGVESAPCLAALYGLRVSRASPP